MSDLEGGQVSYTVKELVTRLDAKVDAILTALSSKVDSASFLALQSKVSDLETHGSRSAQLTEEIVKQALARIERMESGETPIFQAHLRESEDMQNRLRSLERGDVAHEARLSLAQRIWLSILGVFAITTPIVVAIVNHKP